jgi:hypothetical protein
MSLLILYFFKESILDRGRCATVSQDDLAIVVLRCDGIVRCLAKTCLLQVGTASDSLIHPFITTGLFINSIACLFTRLLANSIDRLTTHLLTPCITYSLNYFLRTFFLFRFHSTYLPVSHTLSCLSIVVFLSGQSLRIRSSR